MRKAYLLPLLVVALGFSMLALPRTAAAQVSVGISVRIGPPPLPVYAQPICPGPDYIWTPGYWAWGPGGYYWVPGTWVLAPEPGLGMYAHVIGDDRRNAVERVAELLRPNAPKLESEGQYLL